MFAFCLGTVCDKELARGDSAVVAVVSVPHCTQNCGDIEVAVSPEGVLAVWKLMLDVFFLLHTWTGGRGDRPVVQCCEYLQFLPFWVLAADFYDKPLGLVFCLFCLLVFHQPLYKHLLVKQIFFLKTAILPAVCWLPYCALVLCRAVPQSWALSLIHPHCSRGEELPWHQNHRTWGKNRI